MPYIASPSEHDPSILYAVWKGRFDKESVREFADSECNALRLSSPLYTKVVNLDAVSQLRELRGFDYFGVGTNRRQDFSFLCNVDQLEEFGTDKEVSDRSEISRWRGLKRYFGKWPGRSVSLADWPKIEHLNISSIKSVHDFAARVSNTLKVLQVFHSPAWNNPDLTICPNLVRFECHYCSSLNQLDTVSQLRSLELFSLSKCKDLNHIPAFGPAMKRVVIEDCGKIQSFSDEPKHCPKELIVIGCDLSDRAIEQIRVMQHSLTQLVLPPKYRERL
ncbi:MAG: hypothetical protein KDA29_02910 [Phycisphaerales bacterium]|nr:hypothetical protein [Phycisphaerales bacterium]